MFTTTQLTQPQLAALGTALEAVGFGNFDRTDILDAVDDVLGPDVTRWQRIEAAARAVLDSGEARYDMLKCPTDPVDGHLLADASAWVGDLVPAAAMTALRAAMEGETEADRQAIRRDLDAAVIRREEATDGD